MAQKTGLEAVGIPGPEHLREALTNCTDPLAAIEEFQLQNGILLPSLRPALPFLDLHGVPRAEFHLSIMEELRETMVQKIAELADSKEKPKIKILNDILGKAFPVIKVKSLRPVVMCILKHLPKIKQEYLTVIMEDQELYKEAAVEVKQQIWQDNQALFGDEVSPLLGRYIENKEKALYNHEMSQASFFQASPKSRRQDAVVQELSTMVGKNIKLYDMVLQFLRTLYLRTRNVHYCTLRAELLMALHDGDVHDIVTIDPCHKFTWCLDACIREKFVDSKRARELQGFLDTMRRGQEQVLGDLSMILCDPHAVNTLSISIVKSLQFCITNESMPRDNEDLFLLLRMLALGLRAWQMIDSQYFREPKMETHLFTKFLPTIVTMMVEDQISGMSKGDSKLEPATEYLVQISRERNLQSTVMVYYTLQLAKQKDVVGLRRVLPSLAQCEADTVFQDMTLHALVSYLNNMVENFANLEFCDAVFDKFFLTQISRDSVFLHLLRLIWWVHHKVVPSVLEQLMAKLQPNNQHTETVQSVYLALKDKIVSYQPSPVAEPKKIDSPLMSVPAPTPAPHRTPAWPQM